MTDENVFYIPEGQDRELWEFIPNEEENCLQFNLREIPE
jgi:hypothetical protein